MNRRAFLKGLAALAVAQGFKTFQLPVVHAEEVPVGAIFQLVGTKSAEYAEVLNVLVTDRGFLPCDGSAVSRASYPKLFAALGATYGAPTEETFNLPDLRGRILS